MEGEVVQLLISGGANAAFAVYLYTQNKDLQRRADQREAKQEQKEEQLRARYDKVISDMQAKEETIRETILQEVNDLDKRMSLLEQSITTLSTIISEIKGSLIRAET
tara:strand:- start:5680 stop:6000 length:321 start_codon:yes stop_codon:yes gene_type:complete